MSRSLKGEHNVYKTVVVFGADGWKKGGGIYVDSMFVVKDWEVLAQGPQAAYDLANLVSTDKPDYKKQINDIYAAIQWPNEICEMTHAFEVLRLRVRCNSPRLRGPYVFDSEDEPTDEVLLMWAKEKLK